MKIRHVLPVLASAGFIFAAYTVFKGGQPVPVANAVVEPASAPYRAFIAGSGIIEAKSQNIALGTSLPGIVKSVTVKVGDKVKAGQPLFYIDDRETKATQAVRRADLVKAQAEVKVASANYDESQALDRLAEAITDKRAISHEELLRRHEAVQITQAQVDSAKAAVQQVEAGLADIQTTLDRLVVRAPVDGEVLQVNVRPGEYAQASGAGGNALLVLGNLDLLHVRVDIDENDAWRFDKTRKAVAYLRGNRNFKFDLQLAYVEPYVIPKRSLTGDSTEQVDTRVLQALYSFDRNQMAVYVGQQMDVFIEAEDFADSQPGNGNPTPPRTGG